jgi:transposase
MPNNYPIILKIKIVNYYLTRPKNVSVKNVLNIFKISNGTLFNWIKDYKNDCLSGGIRKHSKKTKISSEIKLSIKNYVLKRIYFRYKLLIVWIKKKYKITISKSSIYKILKIMKITKKRVKRRIIVKKKKIHDQLIKKFKAHIKQINTKKIISIDESHFNNQIYANYGWNIKGKSVIVKSYVKVLKRYSLICAINNHKVVHYKIVPGSVNAEIFKTFIDEITKKGYKNYYFLLDNARIHHSKIVKNNIIESQNEILYNVAYMPELNPIEQFFSKLKGIVRQKSNNHIPTKLQYNIQKAIKEIKEEDLKNFYKHSFDFLTNNE